ncbi:MAG: L-seryl-tRNA(Sec) selenium transferase [Bacteroidetes bacterium]|nr:L-seryl-tRNA(Sec) selenium transferase [Bacteroidota bacterium]
MTKNQETFKHIPGVDKLLNTQKIKNLIKQYNSDLVKFAIRETLKGIRMNIKNYKNPPSEDLILCKISDFVRGLTGKNLKPVYNATGIIVHTNLGRAPFSQKVLDESMETLQGYNNLEFDLERGERGSRHIHLTSKLKYLTGAEDVLVVNNNAAAVMLVLRTFARNREVVVSRGELIEIGGSFRLPEIMEASDCKMVEVGATNKTHLKDYEKSVSKNTAMLFKAHKSNYVIRGFTEEVPLSSLVELGKKYKLPVVYDMGSGLLRKTNVTVLKGEPDVRETLAFGMDLVTFSGDKLIGGPQAGIIAGKAKYISILKKEPMVRALRVGKTTLAYMEAALSHYLDDRLLEQHNTIFSTLQQSKQIIQSRAKALQQALKLSDISSEIVESDGYCGGGALPDEAVPSMAVKLTGNFHSNKERANWMEKMYFALMQQPKPVIGILKKGELYFDVLTLNDTSVGIVAEIINKTKQTLA